MVPLYELTKKDHKWEWNERHDKARDYIIHHLVTAPTLALFQENAAIDLYTDASSLGYGAVLVQTIEGRRHPNAYMSQRTTDNESRYHSYELETLAVVRAIKHFRHYLYGRKFKVITDCNFLKASSHKKTYCLGFTDGGPSSRITISKLNTKKVSTSSMQIF